MESSLVLERMAKKMNIPLHNLLKKGAETVLKEKKKISQRTIRDFVTI